MITLRYDIIFYIYLVEHQYVGLVARGNNFCEPNMMLMAMVESLLNFLWQLTCYTSY